MTSICRPRWRRRSGPRTRPLPSTSWLSCAGASSASICCLTPATAGSVTPPSRRRRASPQSQPARRTALAPGRLTPFHHLPDLPDPDPPTHPCPDHSYTRSLSLRMMRRIHPIGPLLISAKQPTNEHSPACGSPKGPPFELANLPSKLRISPLDRDQQRTPIHPSRSIGPFGRSAIWDADRRYRAARFARRAMGRRSLGELAACGPLRSCGPGADSLGGWLPVAPVDVTRAHRFALSSVPLLKSEAVSARLALLVLTSRSGRRWP